MNGGCPVPVRLADDSKHTDTGITKHLLVILLYDASMYEFW